MNSLGSNGSGQVQGGPGFHRMDSLQSNGSIPSGPGPNMHRMNSMGTNGSGHGSAHYLENSHV